MNQIEREYRDALDHVRFSQDAKERMMKNLMEQKEEKTMKRKSFRPLRAALIAACLCLTLVGTAFAAVSFGFDFVTFFSGKEEATALLGCEAEGGFMVPNSVLFCFPVDSLSEEARTAAPTGSGFLQTRVDLPSWAAAEQFLGVNLASSGILDERAEPLPNRAGEENTCQIDLNGVGPNNINVTAMYDLDQVRLRVNAHVMTESTPPVIRDSFWYASAVAEYTYENYVTPSGLETVIIEYPEWNEYEAVFIINGAGYIVDAHSLHLGLDVALEQDVLCVLKEVLDSFA